MFYDRMPFLHFNSKCWVTGQTKEISLPVWSGTVLKMTEKQPKTDEECSDV